MSTDFSASLEYGQIGESLIARWLQRRGWYIIPIYEKQIDDGKGPRVYAPRGERIVAPDALIMHPDTRQVVFVECKRKSVFSWYRKTQSWQTGIDNRHWEHYLRLQEQTGYDIWLLFLHEKSEKPGWNEPYPCPVGLFGQDIAKLKNLGRFGGEHARGMMYWDCDDLLLFAELDEVLRPAPDDDRSESCDPILASGSASLARLQPSPQPVSTPEPSAKAKGRRKRVSEGQLSIFS